MLTSDNPIVHQLITHIAPLLIDTHFVQKLSTRFISEVVSGYRASALSQTHNAPGSLRAGDRLPNLEVSFWEQQFQIPDYGHLKPLISRSTQIVIKVGGRD